MRNQLFETCRQFTYHQYRNVPWNQQLEIRETLLRHALAINQENGGMIITLGPANKNRAARDLWHQVSGRTLAGRYPPFHPGGAGDESGTEGEMTVKPGMLLKVGKLNSNAAGRPDLAAAGGEWV